MDRSALKTIMEEEKMERRYTALRVIASGMKILGAMVGILTVLAVCGLIGAGFQLGTEIERWSRTLGQNQSGLGAITGLAGGLLASLLPIILGGSTSLILFAGGEALYVQIDIEENTHKMARILSQRVPQPALAYPGFQQSLSSQVNPELIQDQANPLKIYCPKCGTKLNASDKICPQCSYDLS